MKNKFWTVVGAMGLSVLMSVPAAAEAPADNTVQGRSSVEADRRTGLDSNGTGITFTFVSDDPKSQEKEAPSFTLQDRRANKAAPKESAKDVQERAQASDTLRELREKGETPGAQALENGTAAEEGPSLKRQRPDINVCMQNSRTYREYGWTIDHFFHCQGTRQTLYKHRCRLWFCYPIGSFSFRATTIGEGFDNQRRIYYGTLLDEIQVRGDVSGLSMRHTINCRALGQNDPACQGEIGNGRTASLADWQRDRSSYYFFRSAHGGDAPDLKAYYDITQSFTAIYQDGRTRTITTGRGGHRCDSASYIPGRSSACVFDVVIPVMSSISIRDPEVRHTARNIRDAQYRPERTMPPYAAKSVPGAPDSGQPLTRNYYDRDMQDRSRSRVRAVCQRYWPGYVDRGLECDEYPFASTDQSAGANPPHQNFAAKAIPKDDNRKGGERINEFYKVDRILDSDPFYVRIGS